MEETNYTALIENIWKEAGLPAPDEATIAAILEEAKKADEKAPGEYQFGTHVSWWARQFASEEKKKQA